jgi:hypothetical protein
MGVALLPCYKCGSLSRAAAERLIKVEAGGSTAQKMGWDGKLYAEVSEISHQKDVLLCERCMGQLLIETGHCGSREGRRRAEPPKAVVVPEATPVYPQPPGATIRPFIECPDCGRQISARAPSCLHCGCPLDNSTTSKETGTTSRVCPHCRGIGVGKVRGIVLTCLFLIPGIIYYIYMESVPFLLIVGAVSGNDRSYA